MKKDQWEEIFEKDYTRDDCPIASGEAAKFIRDRNPQYAKNKTFTLKAISRHITANAWHLRRRELKRRSARNWLRENVLESTERDIQRGLAIIGAADSEMARTEVLMRSIPTTGSGQSERYVDPMQAAKVLKLVSSIRLDCVEMYQRANDMIHGKGTEKDIFDNSIQLETLDPKELVEAYREATLPPAPDGDDE